MPKLEITQKHSVTAADAKAKLSALSNELSEKYGLTSKWHSDTEAKVERTGATGSIKIEPEHIRVALDLAFVLSPMKGKIEEKIREELKKLFG